MPKREAACPELVCQSLPQFCTAPAFSDFCTVGGASGRKTSSRATCHSNEIEKSGSPSSTADNPVQSAAKVRTNPPRELC